MGAGLRRAGRAGGSAGAAPEHPSRRPDRGPRRPPRRAAAAGRDRAARLSRLVLPVAHATTRTSATTPSTRSASRYRCSSRAGSRRESWFKPELLKLPLATVRQWMDGRPALRLYRFAIEDLYRQQEHVLDEEGERLLSLRQPPRRPRPTRPTRRSPPPTSRFPTLRLSTGEEVVSQLRPVPRAPRHAAASRRPRAPPSPRFYETYERSLNTYAALYNGVCQRDWFQARRARLRHHAGSRAPRQQHPDRGRREPDRDDPRRRRAAAALPPPAHARASGLGRRTTSTTPASRSSTLDRRYRYDEACCDWIDRRRWRRSAPTTSSACAHGFAGRWIDVYENEGKRSGAYSARVYGVHPYMLLNYNDTLDDVFTLAHEMGHSMHTMLSHETQPFVYASYTIFVAEVASTLSEALLLEPCSPARSDPRERVVLLQHAIDNIAGTFYTQVLFADYELEAHRAGERGQPITAETLTELYFALLQRLLRRRDRPRRALPHHLGAHPALLQVPYYVYQYATCFAAVGADLPGVAAGHRRGRAPGGGAALPRALARRGQRLPDRPAAGGGGRPDAPRAGRGGGRRARSPRRAARERDRRPVEDRARILMPAPVDAHRRPDSAVASAARRRGREQARQGACGALGQGEQGQPATGPMAAGAASEPDDNRALGPATAAPVSDPARVGASADALRRPAG